VVVFVFNVCLFAFCYFVVCCTVCYLVSIWFTFLLWLITLCFCVVVLWFIVCCLWYLFVFVGVVIRFCVGLLLCRIVSCFVCVLFWLGCGTHVLASCFQLVWCRNFVWFNPFCLCWCVFGACWVGLLLACGLLVDVLLYFGVVDVFVFVGVVACVGAGLVL